MKKVLCLILALAMLCCVFSGCGGIEAVSTEVPATDSTVSAVSEAPEVIDAPAGAAEADVAEESTEEPAEVADGVELLEFPVETDETVSMFTSVNTAITPYIDMENYEQLSVFRGWSEATGVTLDIQAASAELAKEQFNLLAASDSVPDIVIQGGAWYPGGASAGVADEVFLNLIDYMDYMPNYLAAIDKYGFRSNVMNDEEITAMWQININNMPVAGVVTRGDLLDNIGMKKEDIKTFDDWDKMLRGMKDQPGVVAPLALSVIGDMGISNVIGAGFGIDATYENGSYVSLPLFVVDGKIQFGFLTDAYDRYLETLSTWYKDGLINENILSMEGGPYCDEYVLRGENTTFTTMYSNMAYYASQIGDEAYYVSLYSPMEHEDDVFHFSSEEEVSLESGVWNVGFNCQNPELVVQMIDWLFTEEGSRLASYGIEGEAYNMKDGEIELTELITNNPDGLSASTAMILYAGDLIPCIKDASRLKSTYGEDVIEAIDFASSQEKDGAYNMPSGLKATFTQEENDIYAQYSPDLLTYMSEHALAFLMGQESLDNLPEFKQTLRDLHIDEIIGVYQAAYDRMMAEG